MEDELAVLSANFAEAGTGSGVGSFGRAEDGDLVEGIFGEVAAGEVEERVVGDITPAIFHGDFTALGGGDIEGEIAAFEDGDIFQGDVSGAEELDRATHAFHGGVDDFDVTDVIVGANTILGERNHLTSRNGLLFTVKHVEVVFDGAADFLFEDVIGGSKGSGEGAVLNQGAIDIMEVHAVAEGLLEHLAADKFGVVGLINRHEAMLVEAAVTASAFSVEIGVSIWDGSFDDEDTVEEAVAISPDFELVTSDAVLGVGHVDDVAKVASDKGVVLAIDMPAIGDVGASGKFALD